MNKIEVFKEIKTGGITKEELIRQLISKGIQFNKYAETLFKHASFAPSEKVETVKMVKVKLSDFDLSNPSSFQELVNRAANLGLKLCPLYLGAFLRLEHMNQREGSYLTIASAKPERDESYPNGFYIRNHEKALWLRGYRADDFCDWPNDNEFVFLK